MSRQGRGCAADPVLVENAFSPDTVRDTSRIGPESPAGRKRPRMVWTPALHSAFVAVVQELGVESAVPKAIMQVLRFVTEPTDLHVSWLLQSACLGFMQGEAHAALAANTVARCFNYWSRSLRTNNASTCTCFGDKKSTLVPRSAVCHPAGVTARGLARAMKSGR